MNTAQFDVLVVGGGIAGVSVGAALAQTRRVAVLERERLPGYHATGRSAALFCETYGSPQIRALSRGSRAFLAAPPAGFTETALLLPRGLLYVAHEDQLERLCRFAEEPDLRDKRPLLDTDAARALSPLLRPEHAVAALHDPDASDIEVHALHQGYLRLLRRRGGLYAAPADVLALERRNGLWTLDCGSARYSAPVVVNAAGAWADRIAALAGVAPIGLEPRRRTAVMIEAPEHADLAQWPLTLDVDETFYFKPDAGRLLLSPADETPSEPCDAAPEELDVAIAIDRFERATTLQVRRVLQRWAGLRSFVADRNPVVGYAADVPGFFWLAAQGGYGIQTAPAMARLAAALLQERPVPADLLALGVDASSLSPERLRTATPDPVPADTF